MTAEQIIENIRIYVDMIADECDIVGNIAHIDAVSAIDKLAKEVRRKEFGKEDHAKGTMQ